MKKFRIKKGDLVKVIAGKHKGKQAPVLKILTKKERVLLEGIHNIKHVKPSQENQEGGIQNIGATIHISNVALMDPKNKKETTKVTYKIENNKKTRIAKNSKAKLS